MMNWISTKDRLPKPNTDVLVCYAPRNNIFISRLQGDLWQDEEGNQVFSLYYITHWMPLPAPPKEGYKISLPANLKQCLKTIKNECPKEYGLRNCGIEKGYCIEVWSQACVSCWEQAIEEIGDVE